MGVQFMENDHATQRTQGVVLKGGTSRGDGSAGDKNLEKWVGKGLIA
jgi:hypothetical protein